jgi:hypothetical protein
VFYAIKISLRKPLVLVSKKIIIQDLAGSGPCLTQFIFGIICPDTVKSTKKKR